MANQQARHDDNRVPALIGHSSITDPSETRRVLVTDGAVKVTNYDVNGVAGLNINDPQTQKAVSVDAIGQLRTVETIRLVGTAFSGTTKDTNFWAETVTGTGSVTQAGEVYLATGTTADSTAIYYTVDKARKVTGATNQFRAVARLVTAVDEDNLRRLGCYDDNEGFFFQVDGLTFGVGSRKGGVDTIVESGSFNGNYGASVEMDTLTKRLVIDLSEFSIRFFVNDILLHTIITPNATATNTLDLPVRGENVNRDGNTTNNSFEIRFASIVRLGSITTQPKYYHFPVGQTAGVTLKFGAGNIQALILNSSLNNAVVSLADSTTGATPLIFQTGSLTARTDPNEIDFRGVPFSDGLRLIVATANASVTVIYE